MAEVQPCSVLMQQLIARLPKEQQEQARHILSLLPRSLSVEEAAHWFTSRWNEASQKHSDTSTMLQVMAHDLEELVLGTCSTQQQHAAAAGQLLAPPQAPPHAAATGPYQLVEKAHPDTAVVEVCDPAAAAKCEQPLQAAAAASTTHHWQSGSYHHPPPPPALQSSTAAAAWPSATNSQLPLSQSAATKSSVAAAEANRPAAVRSLEGAAGATTLTTKGAGAASLRLAGTAATAAGTGDQGAAAAATAAAAGSATPAELMKLLLDQKRRKRAEQARKAQLLQQVDKQLQQVQCDVHALQAELEAQGILKGADLEQLTVQQLMEQLQQQDEEEQQLVQQLMAEEADLQGLEDRFAQMQERDRQQDARLSLELMEFV